MRFPDTIFHSIQQVSLRPKGGKRPGVRECIILLLFFFTLPLHSQAQEEIFLQAQFAYDTGRFQEADSLLNLCINTMKGNDLVRAYRLRAFCNFNLDQPEQAEAYVEKLLEVDPYYTSYDDSPRFADVITRLKKKSTITTASHMEETAEEVPVPITVITEEMIRATGSRSLSDILLLYVPGLSAIGSIEKNVAMRGIYGLTQETILVLIDGHRINSPCINAGAIDFRHDIEKIKQIEILRGPASSLYGNVALTAVINIITKPGNSLEGLQATARAGSFNTYSGSLIFGQGNLRSDILAWGSVYSSIGQRQWDNGTLHYIDGYNQKPAFDFGAKMKWGDFKIEAIGQHGKLVPYHNLVTIGNIYSYDRYTQQSGEKPGISRTNIRIDGDYSHVWGSFSLSANLFAAVERLQLYNVIADTLLPEISRQMQTDFGLGSQFEPHISGVWENIKWEDYSFGGAVNAAYNYHLPNNMQGSLLGGIQYECFTLTDASFTLGAYYTDIYMTNNIIFYTGSEHTISAFTQLKHKFTNHLIFNGGLRFDHKIRLQGRHINTFSPRVSLIWMPNHVISLKGGYSHSFVDAPYFYRSAQVPIFSTGDALNPEKMDAYQIGANFNWEPLHLRYEVNLFYNNVTDMVYFNSTTYGSSSLGNTSKIRMVGIENVLQYTTRNTLINFNCTYQYPTFIENFSSTAHNISNVPRFLANLTATQKCLSGRRLGELWVRANLHMQSEVECLDNDILNKVQLSMAGIYHIVTVTQPAIAILGAGIEWNTPFRLTLALDAYNLLNTRYRIGGQLQDGIPAQGFSLMGKVSYKF